MKEHSVFVIDNDPSVRDALLQALRGRGVRARGCLAVARDCADSPLPLRAVWNMRICPLERVDVWLGRL